ncbi:hypothetical protein SAMN05421811_113140 [Nonomuraea wenchangensis]|uniref:Uncharacterized protein n=1 Tax=Nonomuraea wenchangensis TaxID=568860 RepID=A0A1I0L835_9ACTN|nr:hypothetical protein SAMN05421811_113140 [Nonomuraea wenchangensis]
MPPRSRRFGGNGAYEPVYDAPVEDEPYLIDDERRMVRDDEGTEVVSDITIPTAAR